MTDIPVSALIEQIQAHVRYDRPAQALALCTHILYYYPKHLETYSLMAQAFDAKGDQNSALDIYRRVLSADPENPSAYVGLARIFEKRRHLEEAVWHMERAYELAPAQPDVRAELHRLYALFSGSPRDRLKLTRGGLARLYAQEGMYEQAIHEYREIGTQMLSRYDIRVALIEALWRADKTRDAAQAAHSLLDALPFCLKANLILGTAWHESSISESQEFLKRAQAVDPSNQVAHRLLGARSPLRGTQAMIPQYVPGAPPPTHLYGEPQKPAEPKPELVVPIYIPPSEPGETISIFEPEPSVPTQEPPTAIETPSEVTPEPEDIHIIPAWLAQQSSEKQESIEPTETPSWLAEPIPAPVPSAIKEPTPEPPVIIPVAGPAIELPPEPTQEPESHTVLPEPQIVEPIAPPQVQSAPTFTQESEPRVAEPSSAATAFIAPEPKKEILPTQDRVIASEPRPSILPDELPPWLSGEETIPPATQPIASSSLDMSNDWLTEMRKNFSETPETETGTAAELIPTPSASAETSVAEEDLPDWLSSRAGHTEDKIVTEASTAPPSEMPRLSHRTAPRVPKWVEVLSRRAPEDKPAESVEKKSEPPSPQEPPAIQPAPALSRLEPVAPPTPEPAPEPTLPPNLIVPAPREPEPVAIQPAPIITPANEPALFLPEPVPAFQIPPPKKIILPRAEMPVAEYPAPEPSAPVTKTLSEPPIVVEMPPSEPAPAKAKRAPRYFSRLVQARSHRDASRVSDALAEYEFVIKKAPRLVSEVILDLEALVATGNAPLDAHRILGDAYTRAGRLNEALERYRYAKRAVESK